MREKKNGINNCLWWPSEPILDPEYPYLKLFHFGTKFFKK
jgi:hypothetical protein